MAETYRISAKTDLIVTVKIIANIKKNTGMVFLTVILHLFYFLVLI